MGHCAGGGPLCGWVLEALCDEFPQAGCRDCDHLPVRSGRRARVQAARSSVLWAGPAGADRGAPVVTGLRGVLPWSALTHKCVGWWRGAVSANRTGSTRHQRPRHCHVRTCGGSVPQQLLAPAECSNTPGPRCPWHKEGHPRSRHEWQLMIYLASSCQAGQATRSARGRMISRTCAGRISVGPSAPGLRMSLPAATHRSSVRRDGAPSIPWSTRMV